MPEVEKIKFNTSAEIFSEGSSGSAEATSVNGSIDANSSIGADYYTELAKDWAVKMDGKVQNSDFSSKYYAQKIKELAEQCQIGMAWIEFKQNDWKNDNTRFKLEIKNLLAVTGVFKGTWQNKHLINADMTITDSKTVIYSTEAFNGYVLGSKVIVETESDVMNTLEILDAMLDVSIMDITE